MAELDVQPKSKSPWWIWLVVALIILAVLYFLLAGNNENESDPYEDSDTTGVTGMITTDPDWNYLTGMNRLHLNEEKIEMGIVVRSN